MQLFSRSFHKKERLFSRTLMALLTLCRGGDLGTTKDTNNHQPDKAE